MDMPVFLAAYDLTALDHALRLALPGGRYWGLSTYAPGQPIAIHVNGIEEQSAAQLVVSAHDPVLLTSDKVQMAADGVDVTTFTVHVYRPDGAPVTLVIMQPGGQQILQSVTLTGGTGTTPLTTKVPGIYTITIQNAANRCSTILKVTAA